MAASSSISSSDPRLPARLAANLALIGALLFCGDRLLGAALRHYYFTQSAGFHARTTYALETTRAEVLVFGSSRANHHYAPEPFERALGASFYNTGRDGQGIHYQLALLSAILRRHAPRVVLLDFDGLAEEPGELDSLAALLPYYATHGELRPYLELRGPYEKLKLLSAIYPFNSQMLSIAVGNLPLKHARYAERRGYVPLQGVWTGGVAPALFPVPAAPSPGKTAAFVRFLELASAAGARVVVVRSPVLRRPGASGDIALAKALCKLHKLPFLDYAADPAFADPALFRDIDHLNDRGAALLSARIAAWLRAQGAASISG
jgi:hypothetical protein